VARNGEGGTKYSPEQSHGAAAQRLSPSGGCGGPWRSGATEARRRESVTEGGSDVRAKEGSLLC